MVSLAGESQNFDGNGSYVRIQAGGAVSPSRPRPCRSRPGRSTRPPASSRSARARRSRPKPPVQAEREVPHAAGAEPERRGDRGRPVMRQIKKQAPVFVAILFLFVIALGIGGYILSNQRFYLPGWVPVLGTDFYTVEGRAADRPGRCPGAGPDREHRRGQDRRGRLGRARGGQGRRRAADQGRVQADLPRRHGAAAPEDRPQGHVPGARPRQQARGRRFPRAGACAWRTRSPT